MTFSDELRAASADIWEAQHEHPFVRGIGDGSLERPRFETWVRQDYLYLIDYARMLALGTARAPDLETMNAFDALTHGILAVEMDLHRSYCAGLGITPADLEAGEMLPATRAYTDFLVRVASQGDFSELVAALLPCMWGFAEIGGRLADRGLPGVPEYDEWIGMYTSDEFVELAGWSRELTDRTAADLGERGRARMHDAFRISSWYELDFWQSAWDNPHPASVD